MLRSPGGPDAGPPMSASSRSTTRFPQRLMDAVANGSRSLADWLAEDFVMIDHKGQRHGAGTTSRRSGRC